MTDQDIGHLFALAAADAPSTAGLSARVLRRQRASRRRRVGLLGVAAAAVLATTVSALLPLDVGRGPEGTVLVALAAGGVVIVPTECQLADGADSVSVAVDPDEVPPEQRVRSVDPAYRATELISNRTESCSARAAVPLALAAAEEDGSITRAVTISGPLPERLDLGGRAVTVRGVQGQVIDGNAPDPAEATALAWTEPDGGHWVALASGYTAADLAQLIDVLVITGDDVALPGTDLVDYGSSPAEGAPRESYDWYASYVDSSGSVYEAVYQQSTLGLLGVFTGPKGNARFMQVNGRPGLLASNGIGLGSGLQILRFELSPGVWAEARSVDASPAAMVAFAQTLRPDAAVDGP